MGRISTGIGLVSGINSKDIIDQLMSIESRPKTLIQNQITKVNNRKLAWADIMARLSSLKLSSASLKQPTFFQQATATSSNEDVVSATAANGAAPGTYQFVVSRLVASQQSVSNGFASTTSTVGAGTVTVELGSGELYSQTPLSQLNGGDGVGRGTFRITDRSGHSGLIDISTAMTLDDVVQKINTSLDISVRASIQGDRLVLNDQTGQAMSNLVVSDVGDGHAAADLGIETSVAGDTLNGAAINYLGRATALGSLNDGRGVRSLKTQADFSITAADGTSAQITLGSASTVGSVLDAINTAMGGKVVASVSGKQIVLTDTTTGGTLQVAALNGSNAAKDLGLDTAATGNIITGRTVLSSMDSVLLSSLRGGQGLSLGQISITNRDGQSNPAIDLTGAKTVQDIINTINAAGVPNVTARLKQSGNGIEIIDNSTGTGNLTISDVDSTTAAELGIAGSVATSSVRGANMQRQWASENTLLAQYNGGKGVALGSIRITNSNGKTATVDLSQGTVLTLGDVIKKINSATYAEGGNNVSLGVVASINANGDGLLVTDTAGGTGGICIADDDSTTAADLNIKATATGNTINGSFERSYTFSGTQTLQDVADGLNAPGFAVSSQIINDGSGAAPYRMSLTARNSGLAGHFVFDAGDTALATQDLVEAQDAVVFFGGASASNPLVVSSSTNKISNLVKGLTIDLHSASNSPVTINVSKTADGIVSEVNKFVDAYNGLVDKIKDLTKYDTTTNTAGPLLGEGSVQSVEMELQSIIYATVKDAGQYSNFSQIGLTASGSNGHLVLDEDKFNAAFSANPDAVKKLFTVYETDPTTKKPTKQGLGYLMALHLDNLIDPVSGTLTLENKSLDTRTTDMQKRMDAMDKLLDMKRTRLEQQFASMETILAGLQSQQQALASYSPVSPMTSVKTSSYA